MSGRSDPESVLRDSSRCEGKLEPPSLSPLSLSSCARLVQFSSETSPTSNEGGSLEPALSPITGNESNNNSCSTDLGGFKLDLPLVYNNLKYSNFRGTTGTSLLVTQRRRRDINDGLKRLKLMDDDDDEKSDDNIVARRGSAGRLLTTPALDKSLAQLRREGQKKGERTSVFGTHNLRGDDDSGSRKKTTTIRQRSVEKDILWQRLVEIFNWAKAHTATGKQETDRMVQDWSEYDEHGKRTSLREIADLLSISPSALQDFQLDEALGVKLSTVIYKLRNLVNHLVYPDLLKMLAFREWQNDKGNLSKCAYYLAEAHGTHLRSDIVDKHCLFFCKKEEFNKTETGANSPVDDKLRKKVFVRQIKDAITFGRKYEEFSASLNEINPNWNIVQVTALAFSNNRFGSEAATYRTTPPLFLSSFLHLHGESKRSSFVNYVKQPEVNKSSRMVHGLLEEFRKVMAKNRHINDEYHGCRKKYWDIRAEHNKHLSDILDAIEESWLSPFSVLLPGNIKDTAVQAKIMSKLTEIQATGTKLQPHARVFLYKLIENYKLASSKVKRHLKEILGTFLQVSSRKAGLVLNIITAAGEEIPEDQERWPTILVLDSELEQLPWDWLPSLRTTSVTRMASVAAIYSAMKVIQISRPRYPEIVDISKCTFILNPDESLVNVQKRLEAYLKSHKKWKGIIARKPTFQEMEEALQNNDIMLYCGHGSGINFFPEFALQKLLCNATPILMGCSSAQYRYYGPKANSSSIVTSYLIAACPSIVGFLWEVTDVECDRVTVDMLQRWVPGPKKLPVFPHFDIKLNRPREKCLATAMLRSRKAATQFLTEAALVNYGLPIETK